MAGSTIGVVQVVLSARDDSLTREMKRAANQVASFQKAATSAFKVVATGFIGRQALRGISEFVDLITVTSDEVQKMGLVVGVETAARLDVAQNSFDALQRSMNQARVTIAAAFAPSLASLSMMLTDSITSADGLGGSLNNLERGAENIGRTLAAVAQGVTVMATAIALPFQAVAVGISAVVEGLIEVGQWLNATERVGESMTVTKNAAAGLKSTFDALQSATATNWAREFSANLDKVKASAEGASTELGRIREKNLAAMDAINDRRQAMAYKAAEESVELERGVQRQVFENRQRDMEREKAQAEELAAWKEDQRQREIALQTDPATRGAFLQNAENDPRVVYEREVLRLLSEGKTQAQAQAQARDEAAAKTGIVPADQDIRVLREKRAQALVTQTQEQQAKTRLQADREAQQVQLEAYGNFFGNLATLTEDAAKTSREMFYVNKGLQMAQAEINAWMAYSSIMGNDPLGKTVGPVMQMVMAGTALAAGQMAVAKIAAAQPAGRANGGPVSRGSMYRVNERGPEILSVGDRAYLMMGNRDGRVTPTTTGGVRSPQVVVNIHNNASGVAARVEQGGTPEAPRIDVIVEQVDRAVAAGIRNGSGASARAMETTYGLQRSRGAR